LANFSTSQLRSCLEKLQPHDFAGLVSNFPTSQDSEVQRGGQRQRPYQGPVSFFPLGFWSAFSALSNFGLLRQLPPVPGSSCHCWTNSARDWRAIARLLWRGSRCLRVARIGCTGFLDNHGQSRKVFSEWGETGVGLRSGIVAWFRDQATTIKQHICRRVCVSYLG